VLNDPLKKRTRRNHAERLQLAAKVKEMRDRGAFVPDIAQLLGISVGYTRTLIDDPSGAGQGAYLRAKHTQPCSGCGNTTWSKASPPLCRACLDEQTNR
jgi:hypothetical protein